MWWNVYEILNILKFHEIHRNSWSQMHISKYNLFIEHTHKHIEARYFSNSYFIRILGSIFTVQIPSSNGIGMQISKIYNVALYAVQCAMFNVYQYETGDSWRLFKRVFVSHFPFRIYILFLNTEETERWTLFVRDSMYIVHMFDIATG